MLNLVLAPNFVAGAKKWMIAPKIHPPITQWVASPITQWVMMGDSGWWAIWVMPLIGWWADEFSQETWENCIFSDFLNFLAQLSDFGCNYPKLLITHYYPSSPSGWWVIYLMGDLGDATLSDGWWHLVTPYLERLHSRTTCVCGISLE